MMTREELMPVAALVVLAADKLNPLLQKSSGEEAKELQEVLSSLNYAAHVLADLMPEKKACQ